MKDNRDAIDFANEPVGHIFRQLLVPTVIGMLSIVILNLTDGAFVGHGTGASGLAAINIAAPVFNLLSGIGIMFGIGSSIVISIHLSRGETKAANINATQALIGCLGITILCCAYILGNLAGTCRFFGSSDTLVPLASEYLKWIAIGSPLMILCASPVTMLFIDKAEEAYSICVRGLPYFGTGVLFITMNVVIVGYLQSIEQSLKATLFMLLRGYIFVIPSFIIMPKLFGEVGIWLAIPLAEFLTFVIIVCFMSKSRGRN